ncbi:MAG: hypothetical protein ACJ709_01380, partial [Nitrososphaeraceae archaeon]
ATIITAVSEDIGVEDKEGTLKEFCNPMYTKNVTTRPIAVKINTFLSIIIYCQRADLVILAFIHIVLSHCTYCSITLDSQTNINRKCGIQKYKVITNILLTS